MRMLTILIGLTVFTIITQQITTQGQIAPPATNPSDPVVSLPNDAFLNSSRGSPAFKAALDPAVLRAESPSALLQSVQPSANADGNTFHRLDVTPFLGKRIRVSAYLKSANLANWAGMGMVIMGADGKWMRFDTLCNQLVDGPAYRPLHGDTDWTPVEMVTDVPPDAARFMIGTQIKGDGKLWLDAVQIQTVGLEVPTTDDRAPHLFSDFSSKYSIATEPDTKRDGHSTIRVTPNHPPRGAHAWFGQIDRDPDSLLTHHIRLSAWMKATGSARAHLSLVAAPKGKPDIEIDVDAGKPAFALSAQWKQYQVTATVPPDTQTLTERDFLFGNAKFWIDDLKVEILD